MTASQLKTLTLIESKATTEIEEEYSIPLDISDIINICREYGKLGWHMQQQVENLLEIGVEEAIKEGNVKKESLPYIKNFLQAIISNAYFGEAVQQAQDCIGLIDNYVEKSISFKKLN